MSTKIDYEEIEQKYLSKVKALRKSNASPDGLDTINEASKPENSFFDITDEQYTNYRFMLDEFGRITSEMLREVISNLIKEYQVAELYIVSNEPILSLVSVENNKRILYYFKNYGMPTKIDNYSIREIGRKCSVVGVKFVSLVRKDAGSYSLDHFYGNCDLSLKDFFILFFSSDEYLAFEKMEKSLTKTAKAHIGYSMIKNLSPYALYSFKRYVNSYIHSKEFASIIAESNVKRNIDSVSVAKINKHFFEEGNYAALIGKSQFAQSLITAEWMYYSLLDANSVDLTVIALGFFKAFEQMLCKFILLHSGEDRKIKKLNLPQLKDKPHKIYLNEWSIKNNYINTMIDSLITFIEDNKDLYIDEITEDESKDSIITAFYDIKSLRNGYVHSDNITDKQIVEDARKATYIAVYYLLGAFKYRTTDKENFFIPLTPKPEYERLREYMFYHAHKVYYIGYNGEIEFTAGALRDDDISYDEFGNVHYSECYINTFLSIGQNKEIITLSDIAEKKIEKEWRKLDFANPNLLVMEGEMRPVETGMEFSGPLRVLYQDGKYILNEVLEVKDF